MFRIITILFVLTIGFGLVFSVTTGPISASLFDNEAGSAKRSAVALSRPSHGLRRRAERKVASGNAAPVESERFVESEIDAPVQNVSSQITPRSLASLPSPIPTPLAQTVAVREAGSDPGSPVADAAVKPSNNPTASANNTAKPDSENGPQAGTLLIIVSGRSLPPTVTGEMRGPRSLIPVVPVAEALGYVINVDYSNQVINVRRNGTTASFIRLTGEVRENDISAAVIPGASDVIFTSNPGMILLPSEVLSRLLDVSVVVDRDKGLARIDVRGIINSVTTSANKGLELRTLDYSYGLTASSGSVYQSLALDSTGRWGSNAYRGNIFFIGGKAGPYYFQGGNLTIVRPNRAILQIGDFSSSPDLIFMSSLTRGVSYEQPLSKGLSFGVFGGRSFSGELGSIDLSRENRFNRIKYDTTIFGTRFSFDPAGKNRNDPFFKSMVFDAGATYFSGPRAKGFMADTGFRYFNKELRFDAHAGIGSFDGVTRDGRRIKGPGFGINFNGTYTPWKQLTVQGQYGRYSTNFLTPQQNTQYTDRTQASIGVTYRPSQRLSFGVTAAQGNELTRSNVRTRSYGFSGAYEPSLEYLPRVNASYTVIESSFGRLNLFRANFSREYGRVRPYFDYSRTGGNGTSESFGIGAGYNAGRYGYFNAQQNFTRGRSRILEDLFPCLPNAGDPNRECPAAVQRFSSKSGNLDWSASRPLFDRVQLGVGVGYVEQERRIRPLARVNATVRLPWQQSLQVSYQYANELSELRFTLSGSLLFWRKERPNSSTSDPDSIVTESTIRGRVYIDNDLSRTYTPGIDKALEGVTLTLNGGRTSTSDINGNYYFGQIQPGEQNVRVRMEDIRADLVPSTDLEQTLSIMPRSVVSVDIQLVKSGSVTGRLFQDVNGNEKYDIGEPTQGDVHILSTSGRDTYTDEDGTFLLSDLPPGEQIVYIDSRYLTAEIIMNKDRIRVVVLPGQETAGQYFIYKIKPRAVEEKVFGIPPVNGKKSW